MANSPTKAIAKAKSITKGYKGLCLQFVRTCFGIPAKYPSAASAWANAKHKHKISSLGDVPIGAPVFFDAASPYGHVAIYLGGGKFRTNYSAKGTVITADLGDPVFAGMRMLGWTEDLNGVTIKFEKGGNTAGVLDTPAKVGAWQKSMNKIFPSYADFAVDNSYDGYSKQVTREFQRRVGLKQTGIVDSSTAREMRKFGVNA